MSFVHLHTHSNYSLLDGTASPQTLIEHAKQLGFTHLALTDHNALYGAVEFYECARAAGIHPIIGAEVTLADDQCNLVLLVENQAGYRNLCELLSVGHLAGGHLQFKLPFKELIRLKEGLIVLAGGQKGYLWKVVKGKKLAEAQRYCRQMKKIFARNFCVELQLFEDQDLLLNMRLRDLAAQYRIALVATNNVHFLKQEDWPLRRVLHAIDQNTLMDRVKTAGNAQQYLKSASEMKKLFKQFPQAVQNTAAIAEHCLFNFSLGKPVFPTLSLKSGETGYSQLCQAAFNGARERYQPLTEAVMKRLTDELAAIDTAGFCQYFLIVKNIVDYCREQSIPCVGRGSAGDSLISYVLGITHIDPLRYKLCFERFINPLRPDPPDIDLDICWKERDKVINYIYETYGEKRTALICTFNTFKLRSSIRDIAKTLGLPLDEIDALTRYLPSLGVSDISSALTHIPECRHLRGQVDLLNQVFHYAHKIANAPRHLSVHPGGMIIAPDTLHYYTPLQIAHKGVVISQYDMYTIEKLGLVKMDILGVRSLSIMNDCLKDVKRIFQRNNHADQANKKPEVVYRYTIARNTIIAENIARYLIPKRFPFLPVAETKLSPLDLRGIPEENQFVIALMRQGLSMGCFQAESPAMRNLLGKLQIDSIDDVIAAVALVRPGAANDGRKDLYIERRAGLKPISYAHAALRPILGETYGSIVYEEQVMEVVAAVTNISLAEADMFRRKLAKAKDWKSMQLLKKQFIKLVRENRYTKPEAEKIWQFLSQFTGYAFNKAHACSYGVISYQTAFLKYYFPVQYMTAVLNNYGGYYSTAAYISECRRMGIRLLLPDINHSKEVFSCFQDTILTGLGAIKELTAKTIRKILAEREQSAFHDYYDLMQRAQPGEGEADSLIKCGALRCFSDNQPMLLLKNKLFFKNRRNRGLTESMLEPAQLKPYTAAKRILTELEVLGFSITDHPLALLNGQVNPAEITAATDLHQHRGKPVKILGWMITHRRMSTKNNGYMKFMTVEDLHGLCEAVLFPETYKKYGHLTRGHGPYLISGTVQSRLPGETNVIVGKVELLNL